MKTPFPRMIQRRITFVLLFFFVAFGLLLSRLFLLQVVAHQEYTAIAAKQQRHLREQPPRRGDIFAKDKNGNAIPLALTRTYKTLAVLPAQVKRPEEVVALLEQELALDPAVISRKISSSTDPYEILARKVDPEKAENIAVADLSGILFENEDRRFYPQGERAAHLLGFVSAEEEREEGRYGLERFYEEELSGQDDRSSHSGAERFKFLSVLGNKIFASAGHGADFFLTIDANIQKRAEEVLENAVKKWQPASASIVVIDPKTGKLLALAGLPTFDPNTFGKVKDFSIFLNPITEATYELGSVMKPITMAGALEEKLIRSDTAYEDTGELRIGGYTIKNFDGKAHRRQTMTQVLEKSLNTGAVYAARLLGKEKQRFYLGQFGFGKKTGIDLPGEISGNLSNLDAGRDIDFATAAFGQGIAVSPLQLAIAIGAIANGGMLMKPFVVEKIAYGSGEEVLQNPEAVRQVLSKETAEALTQMLVSAVRNGFENRAGVKGYFVAGKTGTAQIPRKGGRGYSDAVIHTFVGYAPAFDPRFLIFLQLNEPIGNRFAANTLTPLFHDLAEYILNYYEVPPDEK